ncbi:MAG: transposase [Steroidobacteraceae bacterium]
MAYHYLGADREQLFLMPVSMREWLCEGHLAWFVIDAVARLDTKALDERHPNDGPGRPAYDPQMMCALLLYAYMSGVRFSRRIEAACRTDAAYKVICGGLVPDHSTIARFVQDQQQALEGLFVSGLRLCEAAGLIDLSVLALDGTKIAADASLQKNRSAEWIHKQVKELMAQTVASEQTEAPAADPLPGLEPIGEISTPRGRLARLQAAFSVIEAAEQRAKEQAEASQEAAFREAEAGRKLTGRKPKNPAAALARAEAEYAAALTRAAAKQAERAAKTAQAKARGERLAGRPPGPDRTLERAQATLEHARQHAAEAQPAKPSQANITDPDSRIMKSQKGWLQGYNAQAIVDLNQIVIACTVSQNTNDIELYQPMLEALKRTLNDAGIPPEQIELILADAGYCSEDNLTAPGPERLIATQKDHKQRRATRELGTTTGEPPDDATPIEAMEHRLRTEEGAAAYKQRSHLIEPIFGDRKENRGYRTFRRRGLAAVTSEWAFMHLTGNLLKLYHHQQAPAPA